MRCSAWLLAIVTLACRRESRLEPLAADVPPFEDIPLEMQASRAPLDPFARLPPADFDPFALARSSIGHVRNVDANIPPLCYTASDGIANPCWTCHTRSQFPNLADDFELQMNYTFPDAAMTNRWRNLFRDRRVYRTRFTDAELLAYVRVDNYAALRTSLARASYREAGWIPDLDLQRGFDDRGFAVDGTGWRAIRYKPFPGMFWPTNGSADDVFVRLPDAFRRDAAGAPSREIYATNFAILEAAMTAPTGKDFDEGEGGGTFVRTIEPIDERVAGVDLDRDGTLAIATRIVGVPAHYVGAAASVAVTRRLYPAGVELAHSVRYLDPDRPAFSAMRMKELRYARKVAALDRFAIHAAYTALERSDAPPFGGDPIRGMTNGFGWSLEGWIESADGWLRKQTHEETLFCMGCHTGLGATVDQTFAFPRKVPGAAGWQLQDPRGIPDVPYRGSTVPEFALYLQRSHGGDELRANAEMLARFFDGGALVEAAVAPTRADVARMILPSRERALALDRAYLANVLEQSYVWGRDSIDAPVPHVHRRVPDHLSTGIGEAQLVVRDAQLLLDW